MSWPMGLPRRGAQLANIYDAMSAYRRSAKKSAWTDSNPDQWSIVSRIIKRRKELAKDDG